MEDSGKVFFYYNYFIKTSFVLLFMTWYDTTILRNSPIWDFILFLIILLCSYILAIHGWFLFHFNRFALFTE